MKSETRQATNANVNLHLVVLMHSITFRCFRSVITSSFVLRLFVDICATRIDGTLTVTQNEQVRQFFIAGANLC